MALQQSCLQELTCWCTWLFSIHKAKYSKNQQNQQNGKSCRDCNFVLISFIPWRIPLKCVFCALSKLVLHPSEGKVFTPGCLSQWAQAFFRGWSEITISVMVSGIGTWGCALQESPIQPVWWIWPNFCLRIGANQRVWAKTAHHVKEAASHTVLQTSLQVGMLLGLGINACKCLFWKIWHLFISCI